MIIAGAAALLLAGAAVVGIVVLSSAGSALPPDAVQSTLPAPAAERRTADQIISVFENDVTDIQYGYIEDLQDGRGYTAGRAGFCSACGDMAEVVRRYTEASPANPLASFLPGLTRLAAEGSDSHVGLEGMPQAWAQASADPQFRAAQDAVVDETYYRPAVDLARQLGLTSSLARLVLYDTAIQHGVDEGPDSLAAVADRATREAGGEPADAAGETIWLEAFFSARRATLEQPSNPDTREVWAGSVGRVDALHELLHEGNLNLDLPLEINPWGTPVEIR
ncbi:chitosanase [Pseudonocardia sp. D17]|uniref:chitosanase n=1 Tax=Pseudonocardia sp. D17 TaxID=882661 RepID=UPI002B39D1D4|nr:chitosanase [Pseudonocardia sp. D17]